MVFDGYDNQFIGTKSYERYLRKETNAAVDVDISGDKMICINQAKFLLNISNKLRFVTLLSTYLQGNDIQTRIAKEDADTLIVQTAIQLKRESNELVTVIGNDVDSLILLIANCDDETSIYFYKMVANKKQHALYFTTDNKIFSKIYFICSCFFRL